MFNLKQDKSGIKSGWIFTTNQQTQNGPIYVKPPTALFNKYTGLSCKKNIAIVDNENVKEKASKN